MKRNGSNVFAIVAAALIAGGASFGMALARDHGGGHDAGRGMETHERHDDGGNRGGPGRDGPGRDGGGRDNHWDRHDGGPGRDGWQDRHDHDWTVRDGHGRDWYDRGWHDRGHYDHGWHDRGWHDRGWHDRYWRAGFFGFAPFPRIYVTLRSFGFYGWSEAPFWYDDRYVVRCYDSYGRPVYVEVNPYTGEYLGVLGY